MRFRRLRRPDFRVEFDFNGSLINVETALPILRELEKIPVVKGLEEPIFAYDVEGWRRLHQEIRIPFYLHGVGVIREGASRQPSGPWIGLRAGDFDGALCSHESVKSALASGWAFAGCEHADPTAVCRHRHHGSIRVSSGSCHADSDPAGRYSQSYLRRRLNCYAP